MDSHGKNPEKKQGTSLIDWVQLLFPTNTDVASPRLKHVKNGPYGNAKLATSSEINALIQNSEIKNDDYIRLLESYAIAHDGFSPKVVYLPWMPIPLGIRSPNLLTIGNSGSGKTTITILPGVLDAIRRKCNVFYVGSKGRIQSNIIKLFAKECDREGEFKTISPMSKKKGGLTFGIKGCKELSKANELVNLFPRPGIGDNWAYLQAIEFLAHALCAIVTDNRSSEQNLTHLRKVILTGDYKSFADAHSAFPVLKRYARYFMEPGNFNGATVTSTLSQVSSFICNFSRFLNGSNDIDFNKLVSDGGVVVLDVEEHQVAISTPIINLVVHTFINSLHEASNKRKWVIFVDELSIITPDNLFLNSLHTCRERSYHFIAGLQSINQLSNYGAKAGTVLAGFQSKIVMAGVDLETAEYFSKQSGIATIKFEGNVTARPLLLPGDIANPCKHRIFGAPSTLFLGDGVPPFQSYLTPVYRNGRLAQLLEESELNKNEVLETENQKSKPTSLVDTGIDEGCALNLEQAIEYESLKILIGWNSAKCSTLKWIRDLEDTNIDRPKVLLKLVQDIAIRGATIEDFFIAYLHAGTTDIAALLCFLDFTRLKNQAKLDSKKSKNKKEEEEEEEDTF
jgi:Type IV secretion-system coupling protein DNA-binding domain